MFPFALYQFYSIHYMGWIDNCFGCSSTSNIIFCIWMKNFLRSGARMCFVSDIDVAGSSIGKYVFPSSSSCVLPCATITRQQGRLTNSKIRIWSWGRGWLSWSSFAYRNEVVVILFLEALTTTSMKLCILAVSVNLPDWKRACRIWNYIILLMSLCDFDGYRVTW